MYVQMTVKQAARVLRKRPTPAEEQLWEVVRRKQVNGLHFRRQHPLGWYILDFYCHEHRLVIEVDGGIHNEPEQAERDRIRDETLTALGHRILRVTNAEVLHDLSSVLARITGAFT